MSETQRRSMPMWSKDGIPNIRPVYWLTFDACKGVLVWKGTRVEFEDLLCVIVHATAVRVFCDSGGKVVCASDNRETANIGRPGLICARCEDRDAPCRLRWRIWLQELESGSIFAHTLSVTGSMNFVNYADGLQQQGHLPGEVITNVFVQNFERKRTGLSFRRLQFSCAAVR